ncbi:competence type IV pilus assembly protein ComGB [Aquibacillus saliphilus]|uniref:competence type IV pilus assembly protein ComGB n=1 Tax=Aquibacillus saliphilus TaxID=1909422 RepID=UPI001CEFE938|nr:competence type IV pilus assembly protein ComGB [Aquibacillus saliphilus]
MVSLQRKFLTWLVNNKKLSLKDQYNFLYRLSQLIQNGYTLLHALDILNWDSRWAIYTERIRDKLQEGASIDQALEGANFNEKVVSFMYFSNSNSDLNGTLNHCCVMLKQQMENIKKFQQTSRYPFILLLLILVLLYFVKTSVYPSFLQLFSSMSNASAITNTSVIVINVLFNALLILIVLITAITLSWQLFKTKFKTKLKIQIYNAIPIVRSFIRLNTTFLFSLHLSSLLKAGSSLREALQTLKKQPKEFIIAYYSDQMIQEIEKGFELSEILPSFLLFEEELSTIFQENINNHTLEKDLQIYSEFLIDQIQEKAKKLLSLIQPIFFILMAGLIIFIYLSLMLPMFQLIQSI